MNKKQLAEALTTDEGERAAAATIAELMADPLSRVAAGICTMLVARSVMAKGAVDAEWMRREAPDLVGRFSCDVLLDAVMKGIDGAADKITAYTEGLK